MKTRTIAIGIRMETAGRTAGGRDKERRLSPAAPIHRISQAIVRTLAATVGVLVNRENTATGIEETRIDLTGIAAIRTALIGAVATMIVQIGTEAIRAPRTGIVEIPEDRIGIAMTPLAPLPARLQAPVQLRKALHKM